MAKFEFQGLDRYLLNLSKIGGDNAGKVIRYAVYPGAGVAADAIKAEIRANHTRSGDLADSLTLARMQDKDGYIYTEVSFSGYDHNGVPNSLKARVLESGTSDKSHPATHFLSKTLRRVSAQIEEKMDAALDEKIGEILGE